MRHKKIITKGGDVLEAFVQEMKNKGWDGNDGRDGNDNTSFYAIDKHGMLLFNIDTDSDDYLDYEDVDPEDFVDYYRTELLGTPHEIDKVISVTRTEFKRIHDVACSEWKERLYEFIKDQAFNEKLQFTHKQIKLMISASTSSQIDIVHDVFHEYMERELDLTSMDFKGEIFDIAGNKALIAINIDDHKSFYLNKNYTWELSTHRNGNQILIPIKKK